MFKKKKDKQTVSAPRLLIGNTHHIGSRDSQQDSFAISDISNAELCQRKGVFGVVADGMGGMADGGEVSHIVAQTMLQYFVEIELCEQTDRDLLHMIFNANENINRLMTGHEKGGSTAVAVIIRDGSLFWVSVGDSRIYLVRGGELIQLNREHNYSMELDVKAACGDIDWDDADMNPNRAALTSYLGMQQLDKIDRNSRPLRLVRGDKVLLMSDGVFNTLTEHEIISSLSDEPYKNADTLQSLVLSKQNPQQDNFTAIIFAYQ